MSTIKIPDVLVRMVLFCSLFCLLGCSSGTASSSGVFVQAQFLNSDGSSSPELKAELARSNGERTLGLMYRKKIADTYAMLFVFPDEKPRAFWMKNTYIPLDIIYLSKDFRVVSVVKNARPLSEKSLKSLGPAMYVVEVNAGLSTKWNVGKGSQLRVDEPAKVVAQ